MSSTFCFILFFLAEDGILVFHVTGVQTCALPITCSSSATIASSSSRCPSTTRSTPGASRRSEAPARATDMALARVGYVAIPPGAGPGFDHADVHRGRRRMYVAHTGADRIDVLDCATRSYLHALPDLPGVAGVLIDERDDFLFSSDRAA